MQTIDPSERPAAAELPGRYERLAVMVALAGLAVFLTLRTGPQPVDPNQVATQYLDAGGAQLAAASPDATPAPTATASEPTSALASTEGADDMPNDPSEAVEPAVTTDPGTATSDRSAGSADEEPSTEDASGTSDVGGVFSDQFDTTRSEWSPMTGEWSVSEGRLVQANSEGFDYIIQVDSEIASEFSVSVRMEAVSESLGGGIVVGQPALGSRRGAYVVDFTSEGTFLRWGRYDPESGVYSYIGGLNVGTNGTGPHQLAIQALADTTLVYLDDVYIGDFDPVDGGYVGLVTSQSSVAFEDFIIDELS